MLGLESGRKRNALVVQRGALLKGALLAALVFVVLFGAALIAGWEIQVLRSSTAQAQREALAAAHESSVKLVSRTLGLQSELDAQEDHDRAVLQLYLQLEREALPSLLQQLKSAISDCHSASGARVMEAGNKLRREMHAHSAQMLDKLQKEASRFRSRSNELAAEVAALARADRQRLRASAASARWGDADLEAPLHALLRSLQRPNATFQLGPEVLHEWEKVAETVAREGGAGGGLRTQMLRLAQMAPDRAHAVGQLKGAADMGAAFVRLLQRARLHRHAPALRRALEQWTRHEAPVWDVVELVEQLRAQHVFPLSMLQLHEHEWEQMVVDVGEQISQAPGVAMDADS